MDNFIEITPERLLGYGFKDMGWHKEMTLSLTDQLALTYFKDYNPIMAIELSQPQYEEGSVNYHYMEHIKYMYQIDELIKILSNGKRLDNAQ